MTYDAPEESGNLLLMEDDANRWSVAITKETLEVILKSEAGDRPDMIAVWIFYAYTARWQKTDKAHATVAYIAKGTGMTETRVRKARAALLELRLIEDVQSRNGQRVGGWFVKVRHLARSSTLPVFNTVENPRGRESLPKCFNDSQEKCLNENKEKLVDGDSRKGKETTSRMLLAEMPIPKVLDTPEFRESFDLFCQMRKESRKPCTGASRVMILRKLERFPEYAVAALNKSTEARWAGVFPEDMAKKDSPPERPKHSRLHRSENGCPTIL
jgi:hypothetical protein